MTVGHAAPQGAPGAINIFTVTPSRSRWLIQRNRFRTLRLSQWRARNYSGREAGNITLKRLDILHTATWLRLGRFPRLPDVPQEDVYHVLFCSNFAGEWNPYRQAFLDVLDTGIRSAWGGSEGLPRFPRRGTRYAVEEWQRHRLPMTQHYYRAYPGLAPSEVRGAVRMARQLEAFALKADAGELRPGDDPHDTAFRQLERRLTTTFGGSPAGILPGAAFGPPRCTGMSNFVSVVPIVPGREDDVARRICRLPDGADSPFRDVEGTHFARLAVLDRRTASFHPRNPIVLRHSWLLFAADVDGHFGVREPGAERMDPDEVHRYVTAVDRSSRLRAMWQDCIGFRRDRPLTDLIEPTVVPRFVLFLDHGDTTLRDIDAGLRLKHAYLRRLHSGDLDKHAGVARFLASVRANARAAHPMRALPQA